MMKHGFDGTSSSVGGFFAKQCYMLCCGPSFVLMTCIWVVDDWLIWIIWAYLGKQCWAIELVAPSSAVLPQRYFDERNIGIAVDDRH